MFDRLRAVDGHCRFAFIEGRFGDGVIGIAHIFVLDHIESGKSGPLSRRRCRRQHLSRHTCRFQIWCSVTAVSGVSNGEIRLLRDQFYYRRLPFAF
ncbi:hypothetical protein KCP77_24540 [Salmonella enterica subsp. enterica]|nr:hypothetical protein KCP77_24540 [Salmonella enterica subsp. enterica]